MKNRQRFTIALSGLITTIFCQTAFAELTDAKEGRYLSCDDIEFSSTVTEKYGDLDKACLGIVEKNGSKYAEIKIKVTRAKGSKLFFKLINEDGSYSETRSTKMPTGFRATVAGESIPTRELDKRQELNIYLPSDRWAITETLAKKDPTQASPTDLAEGTSSEKPLIELAAYETLPDTDSALPLYGLLGILLLVTGTILSLLRRKFYSV